MTLIGYLRLCLFLLLLFCGTYYSQLNDLSDLTFLSGDVYSFNQNHNYVVIQQSLNNEFLNLNAVRLFNGDNEINNITYTWSSVFTLMRS